MPNWIPEFMRSTPEDGDAGDKKPALPKEIKAEFESMIQASSAAVDKKLEKVDSITAYIEELKKEREEAKAKEAAEAARRAAKPDESDDDLAARLLQDPRSVLREATKPIAEYAATIKATQVKDEVFRNRQEEFPYYDGEIQREVDSILKAQSLQFQTDPVAVANTYYTVVGKRQKEISEGKIKSRFASAHGTTQSGTPGSGDDTTIDVTPEMIRAARLSGLGIDDYMAVLKKAVKAGELDQYV